MNTQNNNRLVIGMTWDDNKSSESFQIKTINIERFVAPFLYLIACFPRSFSSPCNFLKLSFQYAFLVIMHFSCLHCTVHTASSSPCIPTPFPSVSFLPLSLSPSLLSWGHMPSTRGRKPVIAQPGSQRRSVGLNGK